MRLSDMLDDYARVTMYPLDKCIHVHWPTGCWDSPERVFYHEEDLPQWIRERLAVLAMESFEPPTEDIPNVGRRISEWVYWVYNDKLPEEN